MLDGEILNDYSGSDWPLRSDPPTTPWAMYLSGDRENFDYLCFDLDSSRGNSHYDAGRLSHWLDELNVPHLTCVSGPTGGRHVWIGLADPIPAAQVKLLGQLAKQLLPSLDPTPLMNPATGCVRPPGTPHRLGGVSVAQGPLTPLTNPAVFADSIDNLTQFLLDAGAEIPTLATALLRGMTVDADGHTHIAGPKRALSARIAAMLDEAPAADTSYTLATVLAGCANARWRYADVLAIVNSPALEHIRTMAGPHGTRLPRTERGRIRTLDSAWDIAVRYVAANPSRGTGDDQGYLNRQNAVLLAVERAQERADAMPGLWGADRASSGARHRRGTHSTRAVLDALCLYMAQSAQLVVEADVRRLSADTGYGRTTVHTALKQLTQPHVDDQPETAWLVRVGEAEAPHGQRYRLSDKFSTGKEHQDRTQVLARPAPRRPQLSAAYWITRLTQELYPLARDTFAAPHSLGRTAGLVFKHLPTEAVSMIDELTARTGLDASRVRTALQRLHHHGLVHRTGGGWLRGDDSALVFAADTLNVAGYLADRQARYHLERGRWEWWSAECAWMRKRGKKRRGRRSPDGVAMFAQNDRPDYARYPRGPNGRADHRAALQLIQAGVLQPALELVAA